MVSHGTQSNPLSSLTASLMDLYADSDRTYYIRDGGSISLSATTTYPSYVCSVTNPSGALSVSANGSVSGTLSGDTDVICVKKNNYQDMGEIFTIKLVVGGQTGPFTITVDHNDGGTVTPDGSVTVSMGASKTFIIQAENNSYIASIYLDGNLEFSSTDTSYKVFRIDNVTSNRRLSVIFYGHPISETCDVWASATSGGTVSPSGVVAVARGGNKVFRATASTGYQFVHWLFDNVADGTDTTYTVRNIQNDHTLKAVFAKERVITLTGPTNGVINYNAGGTTGSVGRGDTIIIQALDGNTLTLGCVMDTGYGFGAWMEGATVLGVEPNLTLTVDRDMVITVSEAPASFEIVASASAGGTITPGGTGTVPYGGSQGFQASPDVGYGIAYWVVDGEMVEASQTYNFSNVTAPHTIKAVFTDGDTPVPVAGGGALIWMKVSGRWVPLFGETP